jgi:GH15 family glucan-1,4-alpha-glucosidase
MKGSPDPCKEYRPIGDYAIIGDCHTAALVDSRGSIDWYCPERFDSGAVFWRILDAARGGFLSIAPVAAGQAAGGHGGGRAAGAAAVMAGRHSSKRSYLEGTNILQTELGDAGGRVVVTDFMPIHKRTDSRRGHDVGSSRRILRKIEGLQGQLKLRVRFRAGFDFGRKVIKLEIPHRGLAVTSCSGSFLSLADPTAGLHLQSQTSGEVTGTVDVRAGQIRWLVLTSAEDPDRARELPTAEQCAEQLERTRRYWEEWSSRCTYRGPYRPQVLRSALTLKLLTYEPTGALVAAPTASLPEELGGVRNWDYRFAWLRDSALILYALMNIGYEHEAADFFEWLQELHQRYRAQEPQVLYGIDGRREVPEQSLEQVSGYCDSKPVHIGNAAFNQRQLDIFGEVLSAASLYFGSGIGQRKADEPEAPESQRLLHEDWPLLRELVQAACSRWQEPDSGIWEMRGEPQHFLYSKLMCWTAVDRGIRLAETHSLDAPLQAWRKERDVIRQTILEKAFDEQRGSFVQAFGSRILDASALVMPRVGFISALEPRFQSTLEALKLELGRDGLVYRYRGSDALPGDEKTFALCSFWLVDALALGNRLSEAHDLFERVLGFANDLGLFSEEIDPASGDLLGNFPQGFTHMGLINAAVNLAKVAKHGPEEKPETEAERSSRARSAAAAGYIRNSVAER